MDSQQQLVWDAEISAAVLGKGEEVLLVPLSEPGPVPQSVIEDAQRRGLEFCGVMGYTNGQSAARCEPTEQAVITMARAVFSFAQYVADKLKAQRAEWLKRAYVASPGTA